MNHLLELHGLYVSEMQELKERYESEKDSIYYSMKEFIHIYEKERELTGKIQSLERDLSMKFSEEYQNDR